MSNEKLRREIQSRVEEKLFPLLEEYQLEPGELAAVMKWKPIVLLLGNYSSGKSTLINELLGEDIQITGQAPTDDSFTVVTAPGSYEKAGLIAGNAMVNDDQLPFLKFKDYGEGFCSHFQMKLVDLPILDNLALVDTPGMLDSVTEKGRGYDFPKVVGEFASIADLIVLMFDPHKAGTIKETYTTIRSTLPETSGEERIVYVMSRIDECDNLGDLIRSYGTLCWNLSQMTGRKDIPRIYLTFSPTVRRTTKALEAWVDERNQLKEKILAAPENKIGHILHLVDRKLHEVKLAAEAMYAIAKGGRQLLRQVIKRTAVISLGVFLLMDLFLRMVTGSPEQAFLLTLLIGKVALQKLVLPLLAALSCWLLSVVWFVKWKLPHYFMGCRENIEQMVDVATPYRERIWERVRGDVIRLISEPGLKLRSLYYPHQRNLDRVDRLICEDLRKYFMKSRMVSDIRALDSDVPSKVPGDAGTCSRLKP